MRTNFTPTMGTSINKKVPHKPLVRDFLLSNQDSNLD